LGLEKGDRVGMWSPNNAEWVYIQFAAAKAGVVLVNINPAYQTEELRYALAQSGCRALVSATGFKTSDYAAMITDVHDSLPSLEHVVLLDTPDWEALLAGGDRVPPGELAARSASLTNLDPMNIQYTSGTTGFPKGATLSHRNLLTNGYFLGLGFRYTGADRVCIPCLLPLLRHGHRQPRQSDACHTTVLRRRRSRSLR
jgi:fatty-acyl-CoA synthase